MEWLVNVVGAYFSLVSAVIKTWPHYLSTNDPDPLLLLLFSGLGSTLLGGFIFLFWIENMWRRKKYEKEMIEVVPGVSAWEVDRNSLWVQYYHFWFDKYPSNICPYVKHSAFMLFASLLVLFGISNLLFVLLALISSMVYLMAKSFVWFFTNLPELFSTATWSIWSVILTVPSGVTKMGKFAFEQNWVSVLIIFTSVCFLLYLLFRSRSYQVVKLRIKSFKEKNCVPIRIR